MSNSTLLVIGLWFVTLVALRSLWLDLKRGEVSTFTGNWSVKQSERPIEYWATVALIAWSAWLFLFMALVKTF